METQDQIDYLYPLNYTVVEGDWIAKIARKYPIECLSLQERIETIIEANADFLLPRSGLNSLGELLVGGDFILPEDVLIIPSYICPTTETEEIEPKLLAEYTLCSDADGIIGTLQIFKYPNEDFTEGVANLKNFPEGYVSGYIFGAELLDSSNNDYLAKKFLDDDLNPFLQELNLSGDMRLCNKLPYTISGIVASSACGSPIEGVLIEDDNGSKTYSDKNGEYTITGTYLPIKDQEGIPPSNILDKEDDELYENLLPEFEVTATGIPSAPILPATTISGYDSTPELQTLPEKEIVEADVIDMSRAEIIDAKLIDSSPTPTPIDSFNKANDPERTKGPLPIYEDDEDYEDDDDGGNKRKKRKKNKRKKPSKKRKLGWGFSWPSLPRNKKSRLKYYDDEKDKVKKQRKIKEKEEEETPGGKKIKLKREKEKKERVKKDKDKREKNKPSKDKTKKDKSKDNKVPTLKCGKKGWCKKETPLIGLNGLPRPSLGVIELEPFDPSFPSLTRPELIFPDIQLKSLNLPKLNFEMAIQQAMNKLIARIKSTLIPQIASLIAKGFNICDIPKALALLAAGLALKDLGATCPPNIEELNRLIRRRNKFTKAINNIYNFLKKIKVGVQIVDTTITVAEIAVNVAQAITFIPITPVTPLPTATATVVENIRRELKKYKLISSTTLLVLTIIIQLLSRVLQYLSLLDDLIGKCAEEVPDTNGNIIPQEELSNELRQITQEQSQQLSPVVTNVNGFEMSVISIDSSSVNGLKRRQAIAKNKAGIIMLRGEASFSSNDQILIDELVYYIESNDLKAD